MAHPIKDILTEAGYRLIEANGFWRTTAHYRNGKNATSLSIDKNTGKFTDFSTNKTGTAEQLVKLIKGDGTSVSFGGYEPVEVTEKIKIPTYFPKDILKTMLPDYGFFLDRGISAATMERFEAGYFHTGKLGNRIAFPIYDKQGRIIGFSGRWIYENCKEGVIKWKHLNPKNSFLFPIFAEISDSVILVEGISDVLKLWECGIKNVLCIFGTKISNAVINHLCTFPLKRIFISTNNEPDNDSIGNRAAEEIKVKLSKFFNKSVLQIKLPPVKDFCDMTNEDVKKFWA